MNKNGLHLVPALVMILAAMAACVIPGPFVQPTLQAPGIDPNAVATVVAGTAQAAAQQTQQAIPTATAELIVPTEIPPSAPPTPVKLKEEQADGTTLFIDHEGGYQVTFPQGWVVIIPEEDGLNNVFDNLPEQQQSVTQMVEAARNTDVKNLIRVFGFNFKVQRSGYTPNINISYDTDPLLAAPSLKDVVDSTLAYYPSVGITVLRSQIKINASGLETGIIETEWAMTAANGQKVNLHQKQAVFKARDGVVVVTFSTVKEAAVDLGADFEKVIESVRLLD